MPLTIEQEERLAKVEVLHSGAGKNGLADACVMQAVDWVYRNKDHFTDAPDCTPLALRSFAIRLNDARWPSDEARTEALRPLISLLVGADPSPEAEQKRLYLFADFAVREAAPYWFDWLYEKTKKEKYRDWAKRFRDVVPVTSRETARAARDAAYAAYAAYAANAANAAAAVYAAYAANAAYAAYAANAAAAAYAVYAAYAANAAYAAYAANAAAAAYAANAANAAALPILVRASEVLKQACEITA